MLSVIKNGFFPCPFCASENVGIENDNCAPIHEHQTNRIWWGECYYCGAEGPCADTEPDAKRRWNSRTTEFKCNRWLEHKKNPL